MTLREKLTSLGLLILRLAFGLMMLKHGIDKLQMFDTLAEKFADPIGMGPRMSLIAAIGAEVGCSLLLIIGLATRIACLPLAFTMIIALFVVHGAHDWDKKELAAVYLAVYVALFFTGPGQFAVDHIILRKKNEPDF